MQQWQYLSVTGLLLFEVVLVKFAVMSGELYFGHFRQIYTVTFLLQKNGIKLIVITFSRNIL